MNERIIKNENYELRLSRERILIFLEGEQTASLRPDSAVNMISGNEVIPDGTEVLSFSEKSGEYVWEGKYGREYVLVPHTEYAEYFIRVKGNGRIDSVDYFSGNQSAPDAGSEYEFDRGFTPIPTVTGARQCEFPAGEDFDEFSYLTIPPLFCYIFDICGVEKKLCFSLVAEKGHHNFTKFTYNTKWDNFMRRFWLSTNQDGHESFDGEWISPKILIYASDSREAALKFYSDFYFENGIAERKSPEKKPRFWYGPIACGWIEQAAYSMKYKLNIGAADMAKEDLYNNFNKELHRRDLHPKLMIIDDKWQNEYGTATVNTEKWPDLRGWIDKNRSENGCHTMLWYKLWDAEGLPDDMTMLDEADEKRSFGRDKDGFCRVADPTNPKYRALLRENLHRLLSSDEGCYNADGLKLDFAFFQPVGRKAQSYSGLYGVELYYEYIKFIYECAKEFKPDCVISGSPCHPYFNKYLDHGRLHDYFPDLRRCFEEFKFRKMLYSTALPDALIDTDGSAFHSRRDTMRHLTMAKEYGIPDLYCITPMPSLELSDEDWAKVSDAWKEYEKETDANF